MKPFRYSEIKIAIKAFALHRTEKVSAGHPAIDRLRRPIWKTAVRLQRREDRRRDRDIPQRLFHDEAITGMPAA